ncbi:unnamed protein product [Larinioides sclopetarius]|uniref:Uncharacterized protein n=1 Tax=Larinioides sclopetarius TaxID=280406 RepID=A0AAV2C0R9_9ARAC
MYLLILEIYQDTQESSMVICHLGHRNKKQFYVSISFKAYVELSNNKQVMSHYICRPLLWCLNSPK